MSMAQERYSMGECVSCGDRLDDVSLAAGFSECGDCDPDPTDAAREELAQTWPSLPAWAIAETVNAGLHRGGDDRYDQGA